MALDPGNQPQKAFDRSLTLFGMLVWPKHYMASSFLLLQNIVYGFDFIVASAGLVVWSTRSPPIPNSGSLPDRMCFHGSNDRLRNFISHAHPSLEMTRARFAGYHGAHPDIQFDDQCIEKNAQLFPFGIATVRCKCCITLQTKDQRPPTLVSQSQFLPEPANQRRRQAPIPELAPSFQPNTKHS